MNFLRSLKIEKGTPLLAAHRGVCGGNVPCNTLAAFKAAVFQGADIVELDVDQTKDGVLVIQHPGLEKVHLSYPDSLRNLTFEEVKAVRRLNQDLEKTQYPVLTLEEALTFLKGKAIVNIDKFWEHPQEIATLVRKLHMEADVIIKAAAKEEYLVDMEKYAPDLPFMSICRGTDDVTERMLQKKVNYVGTEVLFDQDTDPVASKEYIQKMHDAGLVVWCNSIVYDYLDVLASEHTDDISVAGEPEKGWGWLADRGFDIIQTDFLLNCKVFLENR